MKVIFRVDASSQIGSGHVMRCLALAEALRIEGAECTFLCCGVGLGVLAKKIADDGHDLLVLPDLALHDNRVDLSHPPHASWLPGGWKNDAAACHKMIEARPVADWLIVDHYALDHHWEKSMRTAATRVMVIDDLADRQHECDLLLDQGLASGMEARYEKLLPLYCKQLLGPRYALLRPEFSSKTVSVDSRKRCESPRLLVMFGGADAKNLSLRTVEALARIGWSGAIDVVVGGLYSELSLLQSVAAVLPNIQILSMVENIATLMSRADLAVGSPGLASWERCACALPSITISQADNQEPIGEALAVAGAHWYLGRAENVSDTDIETALRMWNKNAFAKKAMSDVAASICDGRGVSRVVRNLLANPLTIRIAERTDAEILYSWRNDERTRRQSLDSRAIAYSSHLDWIEDVIIRHDVSLLLACLDNEPVACVRFDYIENRARVSIYTNPELQGRGFGLSALLAAMDWLSNEKPNTKALEADVLITNRNSSTLFTSAGFHPVCRRYEYSMEVMHTNCDASHALIGKGDRRFKYV